MDNTQTAPRLTHAGALAMLTAAALHAEQMGQPQCIVIVDASGVSVAELRMTGARFLSIESARNKAKTAASIGAPSDSIPEAFAAKLSAATGGQVTCLSGGLPILVDGTVIGGIGIGSGKPDQDVEVAEVGLAAL